MGLGRGGWWMESKEAFGRNHGLMWIAGAL